MRIDIFSIFPDLIKGYFSQTVASRAIRAGVFELNVIDIRTKATDVHRSVDDAPFGGGAGMLMKPEPIFAAVEEQDPPRPLFLLSPSGRRFDQGLARELSLLDGFSLICGRYEGYDARIEDALADGAISIGDYVLAGGEIAAMAIVEATIRLLPGTLGNSQSVVEESFSSSLLEYPQYTRPAEFRGMQVPEVLLGGNHKLIEEWKKMMSIVKTIRFRPDLIEKRGGLDPSEADLLTKYGYAWMVEVHTRSQEDI